MKMNNVVWKLSLTAHNKIKSKILNLIENYTQINPTFEVDNISKTDFFDERDIKDTSPKNYLNLFYEEAKPLYQSIVDHYRGGGLYISNAWFQQYDIYNHHTWHNHGLTMISLVYFLELPNPKYSTEFLNIEDNKIFQIEDIREGDVAIFPSFIPHRSPVNLSASRKTSIAFNIQIINTDNSKLNML